MDELSQTAKVARRVLKVILLPVVALAVVVRFTVVPATYWIDVVFIVLFVIAAGLAVIGRVFTVKEKDVDRSS